MGQVSDIEELLATQIKFCKLPEPQREYRFAAEHVGMGPGVKDRLALHMLRDWRFDFAWPACMFAVEVEGISPQGGRHQSVGGVRRDIEKYHAALGLGWTVYRTERGLIKNGAAIAMIEKRIKEASNNGL